MGEEPETGEQASPLGRFGFGFALPGRGSCLVFT